MEYRMEKDTMGEVRVPKEVYWGAQTQRSLENFPIGNERMPEEIIRALAHLKKAAARINFRLGILSQSFLEAIESACDDVLSGRLKEHFPLVVWQTGSGTQTNMNLNEVIARRANEMLHETSKIHPNDHVNMSQSSNDTYPTAMHLSAVIALESSLLPALSSLRKALHVKEKQFARIIKIGRTHLQDAVPLTLGQEFSGYVQMLKSNEAMIKESLNYLRSLAIGGTAVGTGLNAPKGFDKQMAQELTALSGHRFVASNNKFHALTSHDALCFAHGALHALASNLMKIANDIRFLGSGPRCGIGELLLPENEPGSSIMPGKVNPTQAEALTMVCVQIMGNHTTIGIAASQGNFELNVYKPLIAYAFLQSTRLLRDAMSSFEKRCVQGIMPNKPKIDAYVKDSLMLVTALNPHVGYDNAAKIAKYAYANNTSLKEAAEILGLLSGQEYDRLVSPASMI